MRKLAVLVAAGALLLGAAACAAEKPEEEKKPKWKPAVEPKPLSEKVKRGLAWLAKQQIKSGAWTQGEESKQMGGQLLDKSSVADTCIAALAFIRAGSSPKQGDYSTNVRRALAFVCKEIEASDDKSLYVTKTRGTRVQSKLGPFIDTFMACTLLSEVKDQMPDEKGEVQVAVALDKVLTKISRNQRKDGTWDNRGWAPTLAQAMATKGLNRAAQAGASVSGEVLKKAEAYSQNGYDAATGKFAARGSAGVALYAGSADLSGMQDSENTNKLKEEQAKKVIEDPSAKPEEREKAQDEVKRIADNRARLQVAQTAIIKRLDEKQFVSGFGSNGGEEFLSYVNIGESLVVKGGQDWEKWDKSITENMNRIQNKDGSWTGHHCITGRTFCTAAALLVLTTDRAPVPVAKEMRRR